jgi:prepilin-type N-terminal cleavage/methylation domain-containing protein
MKHINDKGFSLVETIIAMAIFVIVIMVTGASFKTVMNSASLVNKSEESNIEGVVGLEMFRHDIAQAGFGLPDSFLNSSISYNEAQYLPASAYNDAQFTVPYTPVAQYYVPRAIVGGNDLLTNLSDPNSYNGVTYSVMPGTDYLALKGTTLGTTPAAQNWTYARYSSSGGIIRQPWPAANLNPSDQVLVINRTFPTSPGPSNQLVNPAHQSYWMPYPNSASLVGSNYSPTQAGQYFYLYGVQSNNPVNNNLGMPFNRADYFVATPSDNSLPSSCAKGTGILYKAIVNHSDGKLTYLPIMDCVADMQVVLGWNLGDSSGNLVSNDFSTGSGLIDTWSSANGLPYSTTLSAPMANRIT